MYVYAVLISMIDIINTKLQFYPPSVFHDLYFLLQKLEDALACAKKLASNRKKQLIRVIPINS